MTMPPLSSCILKLVEPLLEQVGDDPGMEETRKMITAGTVAWNMAILEDRGVTEFPGIPAAGVPPADVKAALTRLIARKKELFPKDHRIVASFELIPQTTGEPRLQVVSMQLP